MLLNTEDFLDLFVDLHTIETKPIFTIFITPTVIVVETSRSRSPVELASSTGPARNFVQLQIKMYVEVVNYLDCTFLPLKCLVDPLFSLVLLHSPNRNLHIDQ